MKTKNMRKKALVSSVAMLLVAVVALSGATFAWWASNNSATVSSASISTQKQSSLLIQEKTNLTDDTPPAGSQLANYTSVLTVSWSETLNPVSTGDCTEWVTATANPNKSAEGDAQEVTGITTGSNAYIHKQIWIKSAEAVDVVLARLTITPSDSNIDTVAPAVRVAISQPESSGDTSGNDYSAHKIFASDSTTYRGLSSGSGTFPTTPAKTFADLYGTEAIAGVTKTPITPNTASTDSVSVSANKIAHISGQDYIDIYIWLEGNDSRCNGDVSGTGATVSLKFGVYTAPTGG